MVVPFAEAVVRFMHCLAPSLRPLNGQNYPEKSENRFSYRVVTFLHAIQVNSLSTMRAISLNEDRVCK